MSSLKLSAKRRALLEVLLKEKGVDSSPIERISRRTSSDPVPLSFAQARLWFLDELMSGSPLFNISTALRLKGSLNVAAFEHSLNEIIKRHEALRTNVVKVDGQPFQAIASTSTLTLPVVNLENFPEVEQEAEVLRIAREEAQRPFNLERDRLLRSTLLRLNETEHIVLFAIHHLVSDDWSIGILIRELTALYDAFNRHQPSLLPELPIHYADFALWQQQWLQGDVLQNQLSYWKQQLGDRLSVLQLPTDYPRPAVASFRGASQSFSLTAELTEALKALSQKEDVTLFMTLLAAFKTLLYRYTGSEDVVVGSPIANRNRAEIEGLIGCFVNTLVLRTELSGNPTFRALLRRVREVTLGAYAHQDLPFEKLVEELATERNLSYTPLFQVMFVMQDNVSMSALELSGLTWNALEIDNDTTKFDLTLGVTEVGGRLVGTLEYSTDLFEADTITRMTEHLQTLLKAMVANPDQPLSTLPLLTSAEQQQLWDWNQTQADYPVDVCLHKQFEAQVEQTPDAVAVVFENQQLTYRELNQRANQLAHYLQQLGVKPEVLVGLCVDRSLEMIIGILGILKAGGAYLPLDPAYPQERLAFMLEDAQVPILLTQAHLLTDLPQHPADQPLCRGTGGGTPSPSGGFGGKPPKLGFSQKLLSFTQILCLDADWNLCADQSQENPISGVTAENAIYAIYTSGSTGKPKGVINTHLGLSNRLLWMQDTYRLTAADSVLQKTSFSFDVSVWEFFLPLITGARLVLAKPGGHQDSAYLVKLITKEQITTLHFVPSMLRVFLEESELEKCSAIKRVICSGEALPFDLQEQFFARLDAELHNLYGPTEAAIDVTFWACQQGCTEQIVPIGRPIANTQIYLLDRHLQPVPIGVSGELHIGGLGLARGYLNRPEITAEKFIANPFSGELGARLYKTGDLARYRPDGSIEFLGRIDHQVKLRGFRIELGEIEAVLSQHPAVSEVVVLAREDEPGNKCLVAYVVSEPKSALSTQELRGFVEEKLPHYMVPSAFVLLEALPLTLNGKVNRQALPAPNPVQREGFVAPRTAAEEIVAGIWKQVLGIEQVGVGDNFFELGGHSLMTTQVISRLRQVFQVELPIRSLFDSPTVEGLVNAIAKIWGDRQVVEEIARTLKEIEQISESEAQTILSNQNP
jgi:amino acid adenylation domain-containing protein